jgi:hypothetical protein
LWDAYRLLREFLLEPEPAHWPSATVALVSKSQLKVTLVTEDNLLFQLSTPNGFTGGQIPAFASSFSV